MTLFHSSVGALIEKNSRYLLIDRANYPFGFAGIAGHIDPGETPEQALVREVKEEGNIDITRHKLLFHETLNHNECSRGVKIHEWYVFRCESQDEPRINEESKSIGWYTPEEIQKLPLEPAWEYWFKKLGIL